MAEYIDRKAAIDVVAKWFKEINLNGDICIDGLISLPAADVVERKTGKWIDDGLDGIGALGIEYRWQKCSECGKKFSKAPGMAYPKYCSQCGAQMIGGDEMSVLIKRMKMPKTCAGCEWSRYFFPVAWCGRTHHTVDIEIAKAGRPDDCPLIEVPEPHGRLIDADEFLKRALGTECFRDDFALMLEELVGESTTIIPTSKED